MMTMGGSSNSPPLSSSSTDSGHPSGQFDGHFIDEGTSAKSPKRHEAQTNNGALRKYRVLLQDSLAIKFSKCPNPEGDIFDDPGEFRMIAIKKSENGVGQQQGEIDHSRHGMWLYKSFRDENSKCYWNATLCEAIVRLEYKGYLVPSTILVYSPVSRHLSVIRQAWSRKMLRNPPGYKMEFVGEIEEVISEPVAQGQFAPLSDSLCWAILELTCTGQEAFVDSIILQLATAFPLMSLPPRELVYQTLERLIRDKKIYQTSKGYFVVTPDTFRFMNASSGGQSATLAVVESSRAAPLDALSSSYYDGDDKLSQFSQSGDDLLVLSSGGEYEFMTTPLKRHNSLKVIRQRDLDLLLPSMGARSLSLRFAKGSRASEILADFYSDKEDKLVQNSSENKTTEDDSKRKKSFFRRLFSFRRARSVPPKSKEEKISRKVSTSTLPPTPANRQNEKMPLTNTQTLPLGLESLQRSPKIYARLRRSRNNLQSDENVEHCSNKIGTESRKSHSSYENIIERQINYENSNLASSSQGKMSKWNSLPSNGGRKSRRSILNGVDSPFYDVVNLRNPQSQSRASSSVGYGSQKLLQNAKTRPHSVYSHSIPESTGNNLPRRRSLSRIDSPASSICPSTTSVSAIYASIGGNHVPRSRNRAPELTIPHNGATSKTPLYNSQRRIGSGSSRYPPWRPRSAYELLAYQNLQNNGIKKQPDSTPSPVVDNSSARSTMTTSTELKVEIPLGKIMNAAAKINEKKNQGRFKEENEATSSLGIVSNTTTITS